MKIPEGYEIAAHESIPLDVCDVCDWKEQCDKICWDEERLPPCESLTYLRKKEEVT